MAPPPHSFAERFIRGNVLDRSWSLVVTGVGLLTSFLTLTALSIYEFGLYQLVLAAVAFIGTFSVDFFDAVIQSDISRGLAGGRRDESKRLFLEFASVKIGLGIAITITLFFGANLIASAYGGDIGGYIRIISFAVAIRAVRSVASLFLKAMVSLRAIGATAVEELIKLAVIAGLFATSTLGVREVLLATVLAAAGSLVYLFVPFAQTYRTTFAAVHIARRSLLAAVIRGYGGLVLFRTATHQAAKPLRPWLIKAFISTEAVALYALAANLVTMIKDFFPLVNVSLVAWELENPDRLRIIFTRGVKYSLWAGAGAALACLIAVPPLIALVLPKYLPAMPLFLFFLLSLPIHGISQLELALLTALREQRLLTARLFAELGISAAVLVSLLPVMGILAVGVEVNGALLWRVWYLQRVMGRRYPFLKFDVRSLFRFDVEDRAIFRRGLIEIRAFLSRRGAGRWGPGARR